MHHVAFEYASFDDLNASFSRLRSLGIVPRACLDHGMTLSYYYADPDDNYVELQCDVFGDWAASRTWMETSSAFAENPIGAFVDPDKIATAHAAGETLDEIRSAYLGDGRLPPCRALGPGRPAAAPGRSANAREVVSPAVEALWSSGHRRAR